MRIAYLFVLAGLSGYALEQTIPSASEPASVAPAPIAATAGAAYVGAERCTSCHRAESLEYAKTPHARLAAESRESITGCEMCHGPGKAHADGEEAARGDDAKTAAAAKLIFSFRAGAKPNSERCLICHRSSREQQDFSHSTHLLHGVGCNECHATHLADVARAPNAVPLGLAQPSFFSVPKRPEEARWLHNSLLKKPEPDLCFGCHANIQAQFALPTHHRVPERELKCSDCHNPHGSLNHASMRQAGWETCTKCHVEKRGPFAFEHPAAKVEGCTACHTPHGSVNRMLLARRQEGFFVSNVTSVHLRPTYRTAVSAFRPAAIARAATPAFMDQISMRIFCISAAALVAPLSLMAQDDSPKPLSFGGFDNHGSVTFGYRFTDIKRYEPKFEELFDLKSGPRLLDFSLFGEAQEGRSKFADDYSLTASGIGGDPYSSVQLTARKSNLYDLRVNFRQSYYYWNRNDSAALPNGLYGLTNQHNWATVRKLGAMNLLVHATRNLRFSFEYYRNTRDGVTDTTQSLDYFGSSATWGAFARANPYYIVAPVSEEANRVVGGVDYTRGAWTLHYQLGYQSFSDAINGDNAAPERSINIGDPTTAAELASGIFYSDARRLNTPVSEFSYTGKLNSKLEARGGYIFYRYRGPASLDMSFDGAARTNTAGTADAPYQVWLSTRAVDTEPNHVIDQGFTYRATEWWNVLLDYRYSRFTVDSAAQFNSINSGVTQTGASSDRWAFGTSTLDLDMAFTPASSLLLRAGVRLMKSDVENFQDGVSDPSRSKRIKTAWPIGSVYYQPSKKLSVRASVDEINNGTSYTRIAPHTDVGGRFVARFHATDKFYIEDSGVFRNRNFPTTDYRSTVRSNAATANYEFADRLTVFAGFSYESLFTRDFITFLRGPAPIVNVPLRDQTVNRVWMGGVRLEPVRRFGIELTGNFVRTTGLGEILGEAALFGPMTFPYATGSVHYDVPRVGRLRVDLQRTYYIEEIVPGNNFSANLLTIAYTRSF